MPQGQRPASLREATIIVDAELRGHSAVAQLVRYDIPAPTESTLCDADCYQINLCLTPRPLNARACYHEHWGPHRFERLGDIFMIPPGEALHIKGDSGRQASLLCFLNREAVGAVIGQDLAWTDQKLAATVDLTSARIRTLLFRLTEEVRHPGFAAERNARIPYRRTGNRDRALLRRGQRASGDRRARRLALAPHRRTAERRPDRSVAERTCRALQHLGPSAHPRLQG
jgi:hypothetical protein